MRRLYFMHFLCLSHFALLERFHIIPAVAIYYTVHCCWPALLRPAWLLYSFSSHQVKQSWVQSSLAPPCHTAPPRSLISAKHSWGCSWQQWWGSRNGKTGDVEPLAWRRGILQNFENRGARRRKMEAPYVGMKEPLLHVASSASRSY